MAGVSRFKLVFIMFLAVVVSIVLYNVVLYHYNYYGPVPYLTALTAERSAEKQLVAKLHWSLNEYQDNRLITSTATKTLASNMPTLQQPLNHTITLNRTKLPAEVSHPSHTTTPNRTEQTAELPHMITPDKTERSSHLNHTITPNKTQPTAKSPPLADSGATSAAPRKETSITPGYILALKIYEQQTMGTGNLMQLQCFASKLNLSVVQPLMQGSLLSTPPDPSEHSSMLQLEDVYDMQEWREHTQREGHAPLVKWEEFMSHAPRDVVLVQLKYPALNYIQEVHKRGETFPHPVSETKDYAKGCGYKNVNRAFEVLQKRGFHLIKKLCYNFFSGDEIPFQVYQRELLAGGGQVTVVFDEWRGLGDSQRFLVEERICHNSHSYREYLNSSQRVVRDAQRYVEKYLTRTNTSGYLAVIARYEMTALTKKKSHSKNPSDPYVMIYDCLRETMKEILALRRLMEEGVKTFLSMDIGKYGSKSFVRHAYYGHQQDMEDFVSEVYGNQMNITGWERTFESVVETLDSGYVAKVQQAIVARAKCVLFVGGGTFQRHTLHLYQQLHSNRCIKIVDRCTSPNRPVQ